MSLEAVEGDQYITFDPKVIISNSRSFDTSYCILRVGNLESKSRENIRAKRFIKVSEMFEFILIFGGLKVYDNLQKVGVRFISWTCRYFTL